MLCSSVIPPALRVTGTLSTQARGVYGARAAFFPSGLCHEHRCSSSLFLVAPPFSEIYNSTGPRRKNGFELRHKVARFLSFRRQQRRGAQTFQELASAKF